MGRRVLGVLLVFAITVKADVQIEANEGVILPPSNFCLLAQNAQNFDFRDKNNQPIQGDQNAVEALFTRSAYNLLVLGLTPLRTRSEHLLSTARQKWRLLAYEIEPYIDAVAITTRRVFKQILTLARMCGIGIASSDKRVASSKNPFAPVFTGALIPLRL